ncbi:hypothetical protein [Saccharopolyspora shandongensis]|uniref:hypothetical protein n=1 Tax=Saccharopolyspora shandongensis TaxID=418495 RepID=UPI0033CBDC28
MHITAHTQPSGNKPNEDWFAASDGLVVILDGATIRTDTGCIRNPGAAAHSLTGSAPVGQVERVAVCSDGAMRALDLTPIDTTAGVLRVLREAGPDGLVEQVRAAEDDDPLGARVPRNKARDDATAVLVETRYDRENSA